MSASGGDPWPLTAWLAREHPHQYLTDAPFHAAIDTLAGMLPAMVDGLADRCAKEAADRNRQMEELIHRTPTTLMRSPEDR